LCDLNRMREPRAEIVALMFDKHLGFMFQPPKRTGMNYPITVALKTSAMRTFFFNHQTAPR